MKPILTLTEIQQQAIDYLQSRRNWRAHAVKRKARRMVWDWCKAHEYTDEQAGLAVKDMLDVAFLERIAE